MESTQQQPNSLASKGAAEYLDLLLSDEIPLELPMEERKAKAKELTGLVVDPSPDFLYEYFMSKHNRKFERYFTQRINLAHIYADTREASEGDNPEKSYTAKIKNMREAKEVEEELEKLEDELFKSDMTLAVNAMDAGKIKVKSKKFLDGWNGE